jgi:hypothetical protein
MAERYEVVSWDGHAIGVGSDYTALHDYRDSWTASGAITTLARRSTWPLVTATNRPGRTFRLRVNLIPGGPTSTAMFHANVKNWFDPQENADGPRYLVSYADDATTQVRIGCYVADWEMVTTAAAYYIVTLYAPHDQWEANTFITSSVNPATVTNAGNAPCAPSLQLTTTTTATRKRFSVSGAGVGGGGLRQYPVKLTINDSVLTDSNAYAYVNGQPVAFYVGNSGLSTSYVWLRVDTHSDGATPTWVDIVYGLAISGNPLQQALAFNGIDFADATCTNTTIKWDTVAASSNDALPWCWRPAVTGLTGGVSGGSYAITTESPSNMTLTRYTDGTAGADADSIVMQTGGVAAGVLSQVEWVTDNHQAPGVTVLTVTPGGGGTNELQTIQLFNTAGGAISVSWNGNTSADIAIPATPAEILTALNPVMGAGNVAVSGGPLPDSSVSVTYIGALAGTNQPQLSVNHAGLLGAGARTFLRSKQSGSVQATTEVTEITDATFNLNETFVANTVQVMMGIEFFTATPQNGASVTFGKVGGANWSMTLTGTPTISAATTSTIDVYTGAVTLGDRTIVFDHYMISTGQLFLAERASGWDISGSATNAMTFVHPNMLQITDPERWLSMPPGASAVSHSLPGASLTVFWRNGYQI